MAAEKGRAFVRRNRRRFSCVGLDAPWSAQRPGMAVAPCQLLAETDQSERPHQCRRLRHQRLAAHLGARFGIDCEPGCREPVRTAHHLHWTYQPAAAHPPLVRPFRWSRLMFTYVVPLIPGIVLVDGTVSFLRLYLEDELHELVRGVPGYERFEWDIGSTRAHGIPVGLTHLIGTPR
jgi:hypothetical protein